MGFIGVFFTSYVNHLAIGSIFGIILGIRNVSHIKDAEEKAEVPWCCLALPHSVCRSSGWAAQGELPGEQESLPAQCSALSCIPGTPRISSRMLQSPFDAPNSILQPLPRTACETKEGWSSFYWEGFYPLPAAGCCFTVCAASLISDTSCCVAAYLLKLFAFVLALSCLHMVCV